MVHLPFDIAILNTDTSIVIYKHRQISSTMRLIGILRLMQKEM